MAASLHSWKQRITRTEDLPRNSLNFFTSRSKVEEQERGIHAFKEANWSEDRGQLKAIVEAV